MEKIYLGKIVSTHGIKGEIKIISEFPFKEKAFKIGNNLIIDDESYVIKTYRKHKNYDMVTLNDYKDINEIMFLMKKKVFIDKKTLNLDDSEVLDEELIQYKVKTTSGEEGKIKEIFLASPTNKIIRIELNREILIPYNSNLIKKIDKKSKEIVIELLPGM